MNGSLPMFESIWKSFLRRRGLSPWHLAVPLVGLVSLGYRIGVWLRELTAGAPHKVGKPVVSIGNLTVGGSGKTPLVEFLGRHLLDEGVKVGIVSSGYGRSSAETVLEPGYRIQDMPAAMVGDEVRLLADSLPEALFAVHDTKLEAARALAVRDVDIILVDDGFQHRRLFRDIDIVTFDAVAAEQSQHLFPLGTLREPLGALRRAAIVVITRANLSRDIGELKRRIGRLCPDAALFQAGFVIDELISSEGRLPVKYLQDKSALLFAGVGNFPALSKQVGSLVGNLEAAIEFSDHQVYSDPVLADIRRAVETHEPDLLLTTAKDWVKLGSFDFGCELYYLGLTIDLDPGEERLVAQLRQKLGLTPREV